VKYNQDGDKQWTTQLGSPVSEFGIGVAIDSNDSIHVTGDTLGNLGANINQGLTDVFMLRFDVFGNSTW
jgi:hypothetical protein